MGWTRLEPFSYSLENNIEKVSTLILNAQQLQEVPFLQWNKHCIQLPQCVHHVSLQYGLEQIGRDYLHVLLPRGRINYAETTPER